MHPIGMRRADHLGSMQRAAWTASGAAAMARADLHAESAGSAHRPPRQRHRPELQERARIDPSPKKMRQHRGHERPMSLLKHRFEKPSRYFLERQFFGADAEHDVGERKADSVARGA